MQTKFTQIVLLLVVVLPLALCGVAIAAEKAVILDKTKVYFGNVKEFSVPATVVRKKVYAVIPSYKRIKDENITKDDAQYYFLVEETSKAFRKFVKEHAKSKGYDMIIEKSAIKVTGTKLPDITKDLVKKIKASS